jgi:hypothetical protein
MPQRRKFVRGFSLERGPPGTRYHWYIVKKTAYLAGVLLAIMISHALLPRDPLWLSLGVPVAIAVIGFGVSGRITMKPRQDRRKSDDKTNSRFRR